MRQPRSYRGFTLVELLVVIGIIAILIAILLPSLGAARRQAAQTKCAAQMKQMYNAYLLYASDSKGFFPPGLLQLNNPTSPATFKYEVNGTDFPVGSNRSIYYYDFLAKYVTKTKTSVTSTNDQEAVDARKSVVWGCPTWDGYASTALGGVNRSQVGIGVNIWPTFNENTTGNFPPTKEQAMITGFMAAATPAGVGTGFYPQSKWSRRAAERLLLADSLFWLSESNPAPTDLSFPEQPRPLNQVTYVTGFPGQSTVDFYRHGRSPGPGSNALTLAKRGGKIAYNIMYADGHVAGVIDMKEAYQSIRMRYPN